MHVFSVNKRALFEYEVLEKYEAGIELFGFEVKAIKTGHVNLAGAFVVMRGNEAWLLNASVPPYQAKNIPFAYDTERSRKLLLHKNEIQELVGKAATKGLTLVPLRVYTKGTKIKLEFGVARHKKQHDKRETIKKRETEREIKRTIKY